MKKTLTAVVVVFIVSLLASSNFAIHPVAGGGTAQAAKNLILAGLNWLQTQTSGSPNYYMTYDGNPTVGLTALYVLAYVNYYSSLGTGENNALDWMVNQRQPDGSITAGPVSRETNKVYDTSMAILAFVAANKFAAWTPTSITINALIDDAVNFLLKAQCVHSTVQLPGLDDATYTDASPYWGGWGYPRTNWADASNTQFAVLALAAAQLSGLSTVADIDPGQPVWENAAIFAIRCLNDPTYNPSWHVTTDGGFMYQPGALGGYYSGSYASMTGAGIWVLDLCKAEGIINVVMPDTPNPTVPLGNAANLGVGWLDTYVHDLNWAQNYPVGNTWFFYYVMSVAKAYIFSQKPKNWWFFPVDDQMFDKLNSLFSGTTGVSGNWPSVHGEEPIVLSTVEAIWALELCLPSPPGVNLKSVLYSNANLYITDPEGKHIGWDPITHTTVNEIPGATYTGPSIEPQEITIPNPLAGTYNITLVGIASGPYNITVSGNSTTEEYFSQTFNGTISPGELTQYSAVVCSIIGPFTTIVTPGPLPSPPLVHDVAVISVVPNVAHQYPGRMVNITVVVKNNGNMYETFNVTAYRNSTAIRTILVTDLGVGENTTLIFQWNTTGLTPCYTWTIKAEAPLSEDANPSDNTFIDGTVKIKMLGDVNADGAINILDLVKAAMAFGAIPSSWAWNPQADIYPDGRVNIFDLVMIALRFGQHY